MIDLTDTCDMAIQNGDWAVPEGPTRRPDLAPQVTRASGSAFPWQLTCEGAGLTGGPWKTKREAVAALAGCSPASMRQWYVAAYAWLEREPGNWGPDRKTLCTLREVDAPESACDRWQVEPCFKEPDFDGVVRGVHYYTGMPICPYWQNTACTVAQRRFGWTDRQVSAAYVAHQYEPDRIRWYAALAQASADLAAGLGDEEAVALGATEATRDFLRLPDEQRANLGKAVWQTAGREAVAFFEPGSFGATRTCWGTRENSS